MSVITTFKSRVNTTRLKIRAIAAGAMIATASIAALATIGAAAASPVSTPNCDSNAVVYCGASSVSELQKKYTSGDGHNSAASIHNIYDYSKFGISSSDISAMSSQAVSGYVTKTGDVYAGNTLVATGALTAGRQNISGSTPESSGGTTFYTRAPSVSFQDSELSAMVDMKNGVFQFAILNSCGNPVSATPKPAPKPTPKPTPKQPAYTITKQVRAGTSGSYGSSVSVKSGSAVEYQITVSSTGQAPVTGAVVRDSLPTDIVYTSDTLQQNGSAVSVADTSSFFAGGLNVGTITNGSKDVFTFAATAGQVSDTSTSCKAESLTNTGFVVATGLSGQQSSAVVSTTCTSTPTNFTYTCNAFTVSVDNPSRKVTVASFSATSTNPNATLTNVSIAWGDGSNSTVPASQATSQAHIFTADSSTITATAQFSVAGQTSPVTSTGCTQPVSFTTTPTPPSPSLPNTGAGDTIGIFFGAIVAGVIGFRLYASRKLARR